MKKLTYKEAQEKSLTVRWKVSFCPQGENCWCRIIEPEEKISDSDDNEIYIVGSGEMSRIYAEYLVDLHNKNLKNESYFPGS